MLCVRPLILIGLGSCHRPMLVPSLPRLVYLVIGYMQLSETQVRGPRDRRKRSRRGL